MLIITLLMVGVLLGVFVQDLLWREVYLLTFPLLLILVLAAWFTEHRNLADAALASFVNIGFLLVQFLLISFYFYLKNKTWVRLAGSRLGWGDVLFLLIAAFYFSVLNFVFFYVLSLVLTLLIWQAWQVLATKPGRRIPLAGMQALMMAGLLLWDRLDRCIDLSSDSWLTIRLLNIA